MEEDAHGQKKEMRDTDGLAVVCHWLLLLARDED